MLRSASSPGCVAARSPAPFTEINEVSTGSLKVSCIQPDTIANNKVQTIPSNIVANLCHFKEETFFKVDEKDREVPKVSFE